VCDVWGDELSVERSETINSASLAESKESSTVNGVACASIQNECMRKGSHP